MYAPREIMNLWLVLMQIQTDAYQKDNLQSCKKPKLRHLSPSVSNANVLSNVWLCLFVLSWFVLAWVLLLFVCFHLRCSMLYEMDADFLRAEGSCSNHLISTSSPALQTGHCGFAVPACNPWYLHKPLHFFFKIRVLVQSLEEGEPTPWSLNPWKTDFFIKHLSLVFILNLPSFPLSAKAKGVRSPGSCNGWARTG